MCGSSLEQRHRELEEAAARLLTGGECLLGVCIVTRWHDRFLGPRIVGRYWMLAITDRRLMMCRLTLRKVAVGSPVSITHRDLQRWRIVNDASGRPWLIRTARTFRFQPLGNDVSSPQLEGLRQLHHWLLSRPDVRTVTPPRSSSP